MVSTPEGIGGAEKVLLELLEHGSRESAEQLVLNPFHRYGKQNPLFIEADRWADYRYEEHSWFQLLKARRWASLNLKSFQPNIIVTLLPLAMIVVGSLRKDKSVPIVASHQHGDHLAMSGQRVKEAVDRWAGARHDLVIACSDAVKTFLMNHYRYPESKVVTIRNGWSGSPLPHEGGANPTVICVANFRPQKNHALLLKAFAQVRERVQDAEMVLLGEGPLHEELLELCKSLRLERCVHFRGRVQDIWRHLARADAGVLASAYEPLGIAVLEYMAAGLPVVASNVGGIQELVDHGKTGCLVPRDDTDELATALTAILTKKELRDSMGANAASAAQSFSASAMTDRYFKLFDELINDAKQT